MNWHDWATLVVMAAVTIVQTMRGIRAGGVGLPLFEAAGAIVAAAAATALSRGIAGSLHFDESTVLFVLFVVFLALAFFVARWLFALTNLSFQSLDGVLSLLCGVAMAWAIGHMFLRIMIGSAGVEAGDVIANSPVAREVYQFRTWNALMHLLFKAKGSDFEPTES